MILVTGGTGFIGSVLVRQLTELGKPVRILIRPSRKSPNIPKGIPIEIAISSLGDIRGLRASMKDVDIIYHLAGAERLGSRADLMKVEIEGTSNIVQAAKDARIEKIFYLSHLGADRASAFSLLKAKGIGEKSIEDSGLDYAIIRSSIVYGLNDHFTMNLIKLIRLAPGFLFLPGEGQSLIQPLWVEDLVTCLVWALEMPDVNKKTISIGGPEFFSIKDLILKLMDEIGINKKLYPVNPLFLHRLTETLENLSNKFPTSVFWLDYLAEDRICDLNSVSRQFNLNPSRFSHRINYLQHLIKKKK
ncbi:MAG: NAD-dependent epimerase/dehydratase family protein [Anaerolineaceae bacterium]|nr:NAD-dependent epimerase/dehydratase family protein [Anaerolineaceae bacterium]